MPQSLTPEETRIAWETGRLSYRLRNIQRQVRSEWVEAFGRGQKYYVECNRRFGKSAFLLFTLTESCIKNPKSRAGYYAPVKESLGDYIGPIVEEVFKDCPEDLRPTLDSTLTLWFPNGSSVIFRGSNNKQHRVRRGGDLMIAAIDEGRDVDELDTLIDSVVFPSLFKSFGRLLIASTPADTDDHDLHDVMQLAKKERRFSHYTIEDCQRFDPLDFTPEKVAIWRAETKDPIAWQREYLAMWVKDPTKLIIPEWSGSPAIPERDEFFQFYHKYAALDSGVTDKTAGLSGYYDFKRAVLIIEREFVLQGEQVISRVIAQKFKDQERELGYQPFHDRKSDEYKRLAPHERVYRRVADNNNLILVNDLNSTHDLDFIATTKDELAAMINLVREWTQNGRILVASECTELLGCLGNAVWDKKREKLAKSKVFGHFDALMALVYLVRNVDVQSNPIPKYYGKSFATHAIPMNADPNTPENAATALARVFNVKTTRDQAREDFTKGRGL